MGSAGTGTSKGSFAGAPVLLAAVVAAALGLFATPASAMEQAFDFCPSGSLGGQCSGPPGFGPRGIAVNLTGNGGVAPGTVYVADHFNRRIQALTSTGAFIRTWGHDVETAAALASRSAKSRRAARRARRAAQPGSSL